MDVDAELRLNPKVMNGLKRIPDDILYTIAKETLDMTRSNEAFPRNTKKLQMTSVAGGVRGSNGDYYIGSYTNYAKYVWKMPQSTNWTNKRTKSKWYSYTLKTYGRTITDIAINKSWRKDML